MREAVAATSIVLLLFSAPFIVLYLVDRYFK